MTKQDVLNELSGCNGFRVRFYKISPYMKNRYKQEYWQAEAWIYTPISPHGYVVGKLLIRQCRKKKGESMCIM